MPSVSQRFRTFAAALVLGVSACRTQGELVDARDVRESLAASVSGASAEVDFSDGLALEEAVVFALANNPRFAANLNRLEVARAEALRAGELPNPGLSVLFPVGPKQFEATLTALVSAFWNRPLALRIARAQVEATAQELVAQGGVLIAATKKAYVDVVLARALAELGRERAELLHRRAADATRRAELGQSPARQADVERQAALEDELALLELERASEHAALSLRELLGTGPDELGALDLRLDEVQPARTLPTRERALELALSQRAELRRGEFELARAAAEAGHRIDDWTKLELVVDANGEGQDGFEVGPGLKLELPVFQRGEGRRSVAQARLDEVVRTRVAVQAEIAFAVERALRAAVRATQASESAALVLRAARARLLAARAGVELGAWSRQETLAAEQTVLAAREELVRRRAAELQARIELAYQIGGPWDPEA